MRIFIMLILLFAAITVNAQFKEFLTTDVTIANGDSISTVFDMEHYNIGGIVTAAGIEGILSFQTTNDTTGGGTWYNVGDVSGAYSITPIDDLYMIFVPVEYHGFLRYGRILSTITQTGTATIKIVKTIY